MLVTKNLEWKRKQLKLSKMYFTGLIFADSKALGYNFTRWSPSQVNLSSFFSLIQLEDENPANHNFDTVHKDVCLFFSLLKDLKVTLRIEGDSVLIHERMRSLRCDFILP